MKIEMESAVGLTLVIIGIGIPAICGLVLTIRAFLTGFSKAPKQPAS